MFIPDKVPHHHNHRLQKLTNKSEKQRISSPSLPPPPPFLRPLGGSRVERHPLSLPLASSGCREDVTDTPFCGSDASSLFGFPFHQWQRRIKPHFELQALA